MYADRNLYVCGTERKLSLTSMVGLYMCVALTESYHWRPWCVCWQDVAANGLTAKAWIDQVVGVIDGKGGGKDVSAQATGSNPGTVLQAIKLATDFASLKLSWGHVHLASLRTCSLRQTFSAFVDAVSKWNDLCSSTKRCRRSKHTKD